MASHASDNRYSWSECFTKLGAQNHAIFESFVRATNEETMNFLNRRVEQRSQLAGRMQHGAAELFSAQQDFSKQAINAWMEHVHKLSTLYWHTTEDRMKQASLTVSSIVPFTRKAESSGNERRKAA